MSRLVVFDIDGTLVDSQATIVACMREAFLWNGLPPPEPPAVRRIVGLAMPEAVRALLGRDDPDLVGRIVEAYRDAFRQRVASPAGRERLFPGAFEVLHVLDARGHLLGIATGKSTAGVRRFLREHGLERLFVTVQTADRHPSKPHPAMVLAAMAEAGADPAATLVVGDTVFDVEMAKAARARPVGVSWGNHPPEELERAGAVHLLRSFDELPELVER